jgi:NAD(P)-dependent dehydrogenase (short-subunit alcohol dehydrogenase family)
METIALITGANKGIGYETARLLAAQGVRVLVGARDAGRGQAAADQLGERARFVPLDVTDAASIAAAAKFIDSEYGHLDILVNNAGIARMEGDPETDGFGVPSKATVDTLRETYETNVFGVVAVTNAMLPLLKHAPAARIVNVSSGVGSLASMTDPDGPLYALIALSYPSSKSALNMITAQYAKEFRDTPIKINAANPGYCATDLNGHSGPRTAEQGAQVVLELATLGPDGPTGILWGQDDTVTESRHIPVPW